MFSTGVFLNQMEFLFFICKSKKKDSFLFQKEYVPLKKHSSSREGYKVSTAISLTHSPASTNVYPSTKFPCTTKSIDVSLSFSDKWNYIEHTVVHISMNNMHRIFFHITVYDTGSFSVSVFFPFRIYFLFRFLFLLVRLCRNTQL